MNEHLMYKFEYDGYFCYFNTWEEAAEDAVRFKVGRWLNDHEFKLDYPAVIKAIRDE